MDRKVSPKRSLVNMVVGGVALLAVWSAAVSVGDQTPREQGGGIIQRAAMREVLRCRDQGRTEEACFDRVFRAAGNVNRLAQSRDRQVL